MLLSKRCTFKKFLLDVDVFVSEKKRHVQIAFRIPISEYESFNKFIEFIRNKWEKKFFFDYNMIYSRLISSMNLIHWNEICSRWKSDCFFLKWKKKKMENNVLEKLYDKIIDVIYETFTRKYNFVKTSQSKIEHIYLIVRKKMRKFIFNWCCEKKFFFWF